MAIKRINTSFSRDMYEHVQRWGTTAGIPTLAEAVRALVSSALAAGPDRAFTAAYQQILADLRFRMRWLLRKAVDELEATETQGMYGGKGGFVLPLTHEAGMEVPPADLGGAVCENCYFLGDDRKTCTEINFIRWNGSPKLPKPANRYCSDWFQQKGDLP
jgi:hypothetical protein